MYQNLMRFRIGQTQVMEFIAVSTNVELPYRR